MVPPQDVPSGNNPDFLVQNLTPWSNASSSGYDGGIVVRGIVFDIDVVVLGFDNPSTGAETGMAGGRRVFTPMAGQWFVDAVDATLEAPVSHQNSPIGSPLKTTAPVVTPVIGAADSQLPVRVLRRKVGFIKAGFANAQGDLTSDDGSYSRWRWSGTIRKRFSLDDRQCLFVGLYTLAPFTESENTTIEYQVLFNGRFWYQLKR